MFKVGDRIRLNGYYSAVELSKGMVGVVRRVKEEKDWDLGKPVKQLVWVKFNSKNKVVGCFDYRLDLLEKQMLFNFMYEG